MVVVRGKKRTHFATRGAHLVDGRWARSLAWGHSRRPHLLHEPVHDRRRVLSARRTCASGVFRLASSPRLVPPSEKMSFLWGGCRRASATDLISPDAASHRSGDPVLSRRRRRCRGAGWSRSQTARVPRPARGEVQARARDASLGPEAGPDAVLQAVEKPGRYREALPSGLGHPAQQRGVDTLRSRRVGRRAAALSRSAERGSRKRRGTGEPGGAALGGFGGTRRGVGARAQGHRAQAGPRQEPPPRRKHPAEARPERRGSPPVQDGRGDRQRQEGVGGIGGTRAVALERHRARRDHARARGKRG